VGLKGTSWGAVTLGTQWTPYYNVIGVADIFNNSANTFSKEPVTWAPSTAPRMDNSLVYSSPNWSGFGFQAMLVMNGDVGANDPTTPAELQKCNADNKLPCNLSSSSTCTSSTPPTRTGRSSWARLHGGGWPQL
jgi:predicted porin